jgi:hypothetical protein
MTWVSLLLMFASMFIMLGKTQGKFGPDVLIGWPNRLVVLSYCVWLMVTARRAIQLRGQGVYIRCVRKLQRRADKRDEHRKIIQGT